jgi:lysophospholipase L1-like esterase
MRRYLVLVVALMGCSAAHATEAEPPTSRGVSARVVPSGSPRVSRDAPDATSHGASHITVDDRYHGAGRKVVVLGDSLTNAAHDELHRGFDRRGHQALIVSGNGEGFAGGPWTDGFGVPEPWLLQEAERTAALDPQVAVIALGTNDAWLPSLPLDESLAALDEVFRAYERTCTVAVLIAEVTTASGYDEAEAVAINRALESRADVVVDWRLSGDADVGADGIHLTDSGAMVDAIVEGTQRCTSVRRRTAGLPG